MKAFFFVLLFCYIKCLTELAEKKKREIYFKKIFKNDISYSNIDYFYNEQGKMILKAKTLITGDKHAILLPAKQIFSDRIILFI